MAEIPIRFGTPETFARVRTLLEESSYDDATLERRRVSKEDPWPAYPDGIVPEGGDAAEALLGVFLREGNIGKERLRTLLGGDGVDALVELGLLEEAGGEQYAPRVRMRPLGGVYVVFDLSKRNQSVAVDVVYPPDGKNTVEYLSFLPTSYCEDYLEACGGSGIAALLAAKRFAGHASSYDIADRSTQFARFNALLNGLENFSAETGDTYEPAGEKMFDRIAVHPPYVPVLRPKYIFHDGGEDGEQISKKHITDLPGRLKPGGRMYCRCLGTDRAGAPFEERIREWLGEKEEEFDIALLVMQWFGPTQYITRALMKDEAKAEDLGEWKKVFARDKIEQFLLSFIVIQRHAEKRPKFTVRRNMGPKTGPAELQWLVDWETERAKGLESEAVLMSRLQAGEAVGLSTNHVLEEGEWRTARQMLEVEYPFPLKCDIDDVGLQILLRLNGQTTGMDLLHGLIADGLIGSTADPRRFAMAVGGLVGGGFVRVEGFAPPGVG